MIDNLTKAILVAEQEASKIVKIEAQLQDIYRKFPFMSSQEEKEANFQKFLDLLNEREDCEFSINEVANVIQANVNNLKKIKNTVFDKIVYKMRVKELQKMMTSSTSIIENPVEQVAQQKEKEEKKK